MPRNLEELRSENSDWTMEEDNIFIVYESTEEVEFTATSVKIAAWLADYFSQPEQLYVGWDYTNTNTDTGQKAIKIKNVMYDVVAQCLDQEELDRIQVVDVVNGPWFVIPVNPGFDPEPPPAPPLPPLPPDMPPDND